MQKHTPKPPLLGPYGTAAAQLGSRILDAGANAVWFHGFHESAFEACERAGIAPCVELKTFRADFSKHPELIPTGVDGNPIRYEGHVQGICLSRQEFIDEIAEGLERGIRDYEPAGVWLDYLTGAGWFETPEPDLQQSCFCADCVADFNRATDVDAVEPKLILDHHLREWTEHKCRRVAGFGRRFADIIRNRRPQCTIGLYMCPWFPEDFDGALRTIFAQDYRLLADVTDVFTPLIYASKCGRPPSWSRAFMERSGELVPEGKLVQPILDMLDYPESLEALAESSVPSWGVQIFGGAELFAAGGENERVGALLSRIALRGTA